MIPLPKQLKRGTGLILLCLILISVSPSAFVYGSARAQSSSEACVITPEMLDGQGFSVSGLGFSVSGLGFSVSGLGFSVSGLGFSVSGLGVTTEELVEEIRNNVVLDLSGSTPRESWLAGTLPDIVDGEGFNTTPVAIIVVDDFGGNARASGAPNLNDAHGKKVTDVVNGLIRALRSEIANPNIIVETVDVSDARTNYRIDLIDDRLREKVNSLVSRGIKHIVINLSFGVLPCEDTVPVSDDGGTRHVTFNFDQALKAVEEANEPQPVKNFLECVSDNKDGTYTAHFGYENPNGSPVTIPVGSKNSLTGGGLSSEQLIAQTPTYFGRPDVIEGNPGRSAPYPNSAFQVIFKQKKSSEKLVWRLNGHKVTADAQNHSQRCSPNPTILPTSSNDGHHKKSGGSSQSLINNYLECVVNNENGTITAHFGFKNKYGKPAFVPQGDKNFLSGGGLTETQRKVLVPTYFGTPHVVEGQPGRSAPFPNSAFQITFNANTSLVWTLFGQKVTANKDSEACVVPQGFGFNQYFKETLDLEPDQVKDFLNGLAHEASSNPNLMAELRDQLRVWLAQSKTQGDFAVIPVASAGNFRYLFPRRNPDNPNEPLPFAPPLSPASLQETIAVAALLGNVTEPPLSRPSANNRDALWRFSHDGNVAVPGGSIKVGVNDYMVGTSFAAPYTSVLAALWLTYPHACSYDNVNRPPLNLSSAGDFFNALFTDGEYPLNCKRPVHEEVTVKIDIRPHAHANNVNLNSGGLLPVAVLSSATFDARFIDPNTVFLAGAPAVAEKRGWPKMDIKDINHDGRKDAVFAFKIQDMEVAATDKEATLVGKTIAGVSFTGKDKITVVPLQPTYLLLPSNGATVRTHYPLLTWRPVALPSCYLVQINNAPFKNDNQPVLQQATVVNATGYITRYLANGTYFWRVRVGGSCDIDPGPWSETWRFTVK